MLSFPSYLGPGLGNRSRTGRQERAGISLQGVRHLPEDPAAGMEGSRLAGRAWCVGGCPAGEGPGTLGFRCPRATRPGCPCRWAQLQDVGDTGGCFWKLWQSSPLRGLVCCQHSGSWGRNGKCREGEWVSAAMLGLMNWEQLFWNSGSRGILSLASVKK